MSLKIFLDCENDFAVIFGEETVEIDSITTEQATRLFHKLDGEMSPENLHMDGEITATEARARAKMFMGAVADLERLGFAKPDDVWCI